MMNLNLPERKSKSQDSIEDSLLVKFDNNDGATMTDPKNNPATQDNVTVAPNDNNGMLRSLPNDLIVHQIFTLLEPENLLKMSQVNHSLNQMSQSPLLWRYYYQQHFFTKAPNKTIDKNHFIEKYQQYIDAEEEINNKNESEVNGINTVEVKPRWRENLMAALRGDIDKITQSDLKYKEKLRLYMLAAQKGHESAYPYLKDKTGPIRTTFRWAVEDKNLSAMASLLNHFRQDITPETVQEEFLTAVKTEDPEFITDYYRLYGRYVPSSQLGAALGETALLSVNVVETIWKLADNGNAIYILYKEIAFMRAVKKGKNEVLEKLYNLFGNKVDRNLKVEALHFAAKRGDSTHFKFKSILEWFAGDITSDEKAKALFLAIEGNCYKTVLYLVSYCKNDILAANATSSDAINAIDQAMTIVLEKNNTNFMSLLIPYFEQFSSSTKRKVMVYALDGVESSFARVLVQDASTSLSENELHELQSKIETGLSLSNQYTFTSDDESEFTQSQKQKPR